MLLVKLDIKHLKKMIKSAKYGVEGKMNIQLNRLDKIEVLKEFEKENTQNAILRARKGELILGRTFSLGQKLGFWIAEVIAKKLKGTGYKVLVDVALSESGKKTKYRKIIYPDIMIVKEEKQAAMDPGLINKLQKMNFGGFKKFTVEGGKTDKKDYNKLKIDSYRALCYIEVKLDVGWFKETFFEKALKNITEWSKDEKQLKFSRPEEKEEGVYNSKRKMSEKVKNEKYYYQNSAVILDKR